MNSLNASRDDWQSASQHMRRIENQERHKNEHLAQQLSKEAMQQWQRAIEGLLALPTATALGLASSTLYVAAFIERGFEVLQQSTEAMRGGIEQGLRDMREGERGGEEERGDGGRQRTEAARSEAHA